MHRGRPVRKTRKWKQQEFVTIAMLLACVVSFTSRRNVIISKLTTLFLVITFIHSKFIICFLYQLLFEQHPLLTPSDDTSRLICFWTTLSSTNCYCPCLRFELLFWHMSRYKFRLLTYYLLNRTFRYIERQKPHICTRMMRK